MPSRNNEKSAPLKPIRRVRSILRDAHTSRRFTALEREQRNKQFSILVFKQEDEWLTLVAPTEVLLQGHDVAISPIWIWLPLDRHIVHQHWALSTWQRCEQISHSLAWYNKHLKIKLSTCLCKNWRLDPWVFISNNKAKLNYTYQSPETIYFYHVCLYIYIHIYIYRERERESNENRGEGEEVTNVHSNTDWCKITSHVTRHTQKVPLLEWQNRSKL
jgi:hypothetical protein